MTKRGILIVEDETIVQMHLERIVGDLGHEVVGTAVDTREALEAAERRPPELVLMDIHLAGGSDGIDAARQLSDRWDCAVVFLTAYSDRATVERSSQVGATGYLVKPFTDDQVGAAIATALSNRERLQRTRGRERSLASALVSLGDAVFVTDEAGRITFANPRAADVTGWPAGEACGRHLLDVVRPVSARDAETLRGAVTKALGGAQVESVARVEIATRQGSECTVDVGIQPFRDEAQREIGLISMLRIHGRRPAPPRLPSAAGRVPFGDGTRLLVYSHDTLGLGHLRRSLILLRALCARYPRLSALLVTGSPLAHAYRLPAGADYVKLPAIRKTAPERYEARSLSLSGSDVRALRENLILRAVRDYDPNVLLVDHSPLGSSSEMLPTLQWLGDRGSCTRILGLRDIIDEPRAVIEAWEANGIHGALRDLYDHVVVYGSRGIYDPVAEYSFPEEVAAKTRFVHYVCDRAEGEASPDAPSDAGPAVVVSIGGGDGGGDTLVLPFLEMMRSRRREIDFRAEILTGPLLPAELHERFAEMARGLPVRLRPFVPSVAPLYRAAEVVVSTAGYNTVVDQLAHSREAVFVPRVLYRKEQLLRARRMAELGLARLVHPDDATGDALFEAVQRARGEARRPLRERAREIVPLDGAEVFTAFCGGLLVHGR